MSKLTLDLLLKEFEGQYEQVDSVENLEESNKNYLVYTPSDTGEGKLRVVVSLEETPFTPKINRKNVSVNVNDLVEFPGIFRYGKEHTGFGLTVEFDTFYPSISDSDEIYELKPETDLDTWLGTNIGRDAIIGRQVYNELELVKLNKKGRTTFLPYLPSMIAFQDQDKQFGEDIINIDFTMLERSWNRKGISTDLQHSPMTRMMQNLEVMVGNRIKNESREKIHGFLSIGERGREYGSAMNMIFGEFAYGSSRAAGSAQIGEVDKIFTASEYSKGKMHELSKSFWDDFKSGQTVYVMDDLKATGGTSQGMARHVIRHGGIPVLVTGIKLGYQESITMEYVVIDNSGEREVYFITPVDGDAEKNGYSYVDIEDHKTGKPYLINEGQPDEKPVVRTINNIEELGKVIDHNVVEEISPYVIESKSQTVKHKVKHDGHMHSLYRPV